MTPMVERVAQAIREAGDKIFGTGHTVQDGTRILAREAIAATRRPEDERLGRTIGPVWLTPKEASDAGLGEFYEVDA